MCRPKTILKSISVLTHGAHKELRVHYHFQVAKSHLSLISTVSIDVDMVHLNKH